MDAEFQSSIQAGDLRKQLQALRDFLAERLLHAPAREQAPIAAQLRAVLIDLNGLPVPKEGSVLDEVAKQRAARRAGTADAASA
jgi:hypothetical protein